MVQSVVTVAFARPLLLAAPASALGREPSFSDFRVAEGGRIVRWVEKLALLGTCSRSESSLGSPRESWLGLVVASGGRSRYTGLQQLDQDQDDLALSLSLPASGDG